MRKRFSESRIKKILIFSFVLTIVISIGIMQIIAASAPTPGSNQDPLVTKSYVDLKIAQALSNITGSTQTTTGTTVVNDVELNAKISELENKLRSFENELLFSSSNFSGQIEKTKFNVVQLFKNQKMLSGEGTEFILRSGIAEAISGPGGDMSDLTSGLNIVSGSKLEINHLIISSRDDGRGLKVLSDSIWLLIKGSYKVTN